MVSMTTQTPSGGQQLQPPNPSGERSPRADALTGGGGGGVTDCGGFRRISGAQPVDTRAVRPMPGVSLGDTQREHVIFDTDTKAEGRRSAAVTRSGAAGDFTGRGN